MSRCGEKRAVRRVLADGLITSQIDLVFHYHEGFTKE
jgi:hypothetical protein